MPAGYYLEGYDENNEPIYKPLPGRVTPAQKQANIQAAYNPDGTPKPSTVPAQVNSNTPAVSGTEATNQFLAALQLNPSLAKGGNLTRGNAVLQAQADNFLVKKGLDEEKAQETSLTANKARSFISSVASRRNKNTFLGEGNTIGLPELNSGRKTLLGL